MLVLEMPLKLLVVLLAAMGGAPPAEAGARPACACEPQGHVAVCSFMDLIRVPGCLPGEAVTQLYLDHNSIAALTADQLRPFSLLRLLSAEGNLITDLPENLFRYTPRMREIYLSENRIKSISPTTFLPVANLQKLVLSVNFLSSIPSGAFRELPKLLEVDLSENQLTVVPADAFPPSLRMLRLHKNHLQVLPSQWPISLEELDLSDNVLLRADAAPFDRLPALRELRLEGNPWNCTCEDAGAVAALVVRRNFHEDMEDPMVCALPRELRDAQVLHALRDCHIEPTVASTVSVRLLRGPSVASRETNSDPTLAAINSSMTPTTAEITTEVPFNHISPDEINHNLFIIVLVVISLVLTIPAGFLVRKIYTMCRDRLFCVKHDSEKLTSEDDESVV